MKHRSYQPHLTQHRVMCTTAVEQELTCHLYGPITIHQNWSEKSETTVLKWMIMNGWKPKHQQ